MVGIEEMIERVPKHVNGIKKLPGRKILGRLSPFPIG